MARHMFLTALIVAGIYLGLLVVIEHPFVIAAEQNKDQVVQTHAVVAQETRESEKPVETRVVSVQPRATARLKDQQLYLAQTTLVGVSGAIDLNNAQADAEQLWQRFDEMKALQNNVDWGKGNIVAYAYYHNFNRDFTWADLMIGYEVRDLKLTTGAKKLTIEQGPYQKYIFQADTNSASDEAWAQAYLYKNLVERHTLNRNGQLVSTDVIVIKR